ncbi:hypothetical protein HOP50_09g56100 [Chloropicon primus]|uniref:Calponin-homology (CH) domain-containing protein n=1 Tax=Chloropicon primus TaxID=1764295 RepID=A0A5B8MUG1_9CHLO|nr:hypothetical protein A3770_09p55880 [Chloropicon primus]UPR02284.1 hypothetical protein HOP50_09g56100 [Chloropicon primus]|eukprot:QDZ23070.1 hypothetical protein A3770_09p55880 [Chloropicon primus]
MTQEDMDWKAVVVHLVSSTGLEECQGVRGVKDLRDCVALCAICEQLMVQLNLITLPELHELRQHDNIKSQERLKLYLEVFESDAGFVPGVDCKSTVTSIARGGSEEELMDLFAWIFEKYSPQEEGEPCNAQLQGRERRQGVLSEASSKANRMEGHDVDQASAGGGTDKAYATVSLGLDLGEMKVQVEDENQRQDTSPKRGPPLEVSLKLESITEDPDLRLAMYPVENENERLKYLIGGSMSPQALSGNEGSAEEAQSLALIPWTRSELTEQTWRMTEASELSKALGFHLQEGNSRALQKHLTSWMRRLDVLREEKEGPICDTTQFRDGVIICRLIQQITGKRVLGGIQSDANKFESVSNLGRGFQSLWSFLLHHKLEAFRRDFEYYPESIVKGNERDIWSCLHFLYKLYLHHSKGGGVGSPSAATAKTTSNIPQNLVTFQSIFDRIYNSNQGELERITSAWLESMPLIPTDACEKNEKDLRSGSMLCQLVTLYEPHCLYSSPILDPARYHETFARDNACIALIALEQILTGKIGKSHTGKLVSSFTAEKIAAGDVPTILKAVASIKLCFEWRDGTFKSSSFFVPSVKGPVITESKTATSETERKMVSWIVKDMELVPKHSKLAKSFGNILKGLVKTTLFVSLAEKALKKQLFQLITETADSKSIKEESTRKVLRSLGRVPQLSKYLTLSLQPKLLAGDKEVWLNLLQGIQAYHTTLKNRKQNRAAAYTRLGQRIRPESTKVDTSIGLGVTNRAFQNLFVWIKSKIYVPKTVTISDFFRDGRQIARLLQLVERRPLRGIDFSPTSYSSIVNNLDIILKFLRLQGVETTEYSVHQIASGDEEMICHLLCKIKEWHLQKGGPQQRR